MYFKNRWRWRWRMGYLVHHLIVAVYFLGAYIGRDIRIPASELFAMVAFSNLALLVIGERVLPRRADSDLFSDGQVPNDLGHFFLSSGIRQLVHTLLLLLYAAYEPVHGLLLGWPIFAQFLFLLFASECISYIRHRAIHAFDILWPVHELHHDTPRLHTLKAVRTHFLDDLTGIPFDFITALVVGTSAGAFFWVSVWNIVLGNLIHANIDQRNPWWLHYLIPTVQLHEVHHSREGMRCNYAGSLPLVDILFGTYLHPSCADVTTLGLGEQIPSNFLGQLSRPFKQIFIKEPAPKLVF